MLIGQSNSFPLMQNVSSFGGCNTSTTPHIQSTDVVYVPVWRRCVESDLARIGSQPSFVATQVSNLVKPAASIRNGLKHSTARLLMITSTNSLTLSISTTYHGVTSGIWMRKAVSEVGVGSLMGGNTSFVEISVRSIANEVLILNWLRLLNVSVQMEPKCYLALSSQAKSLVLNGWTWTKTSGKHKVFSM